MTSADGTRIEMLSGLALMNFYNANNVKIGALGEIDGIFQLVWYDASGNVISYIGVNGSSPATVAESFSTVEIVPIQAQASYSPITEAQRNGFKNTIIANTTVNSSTNTFSFTSGRVTKFVYSSGSDTSKRQYNGYKNSSSPPVSYTDNIANGWYVVQLSVYNIGNTVSVVYISGGVVTNSYPIIPY